MSSPRFFPVSPAHDAALVAGVPISEPMQTRVGVFYATREGHTRRVAERVAQELRRAGFDVDLFDVRQPMRYSFEHYSAALLAASVHSGRHEKEMIEFVKQHRPELERMTTAFLSVTLSEANAERKNATAAEHDQALADVNRVLSNFLNETKWAPSCTKPVAGALVYSRYNFLLRWIMKRIARKAGGNTDTSRDYVYTDWPALDRFVEDFAAAIPARAEAVTA